MNCGSPTNITTSSGTSPTTPQAFTQPASLDNSSTPEPTTPASPPRVGSTTPGGLLWRGWLGQSSDLIVCDTGNNILRRIFYNTNDDVLAYSISNFSGTPTVAGSADGLIPNATFNRPMSLGYNSSTLVFYVADSGNNKIRIYTDSGSAITKVPDPTIGYVTFATNELTGAISVNFNDITGKSHTFNDYPIIACMESDTDASLLWIFGSPPISSLGSPTNTAPWLPDNADVSQVPYDFTPDRQDMVFSVIAKKTDGSPPSSIIHAEIQFQIASPVVSGQNAADLGIGDATPGVYIRYTLDGSEPTSTSPLLAVAPDGTNQVNCSIPISEDTTLKLKAFGPSNSRYSFFTPSVTKTVSLLMANYQANQLVWGLETGEGSSKFLASAGQTFYAPVALIKMSAQGVYAFQFDADVLRATNTPALANYGFQGSLFQISNNAYTFLPPSQFARNVLATNLVYDTNLASATLATNVQAGQRLLNYVDSFGVGWLTYYPQTNFYDTTSQELLTYSIPHDTPNEGGVQPILGSMRVKLGTTVTNGTTYQIQLLNASGVDQSSASIPMQTLINGPLAAGQANSIKQLLITNSVKYLVGSATPFKWFNAGEFGTNAITAADLIETLKGIDVYIDASGWPADSDLFDALDSANSAVTDSDWTQPTTYSEIDKINGMANGDGVLDMSDLYVSFRRSLDPSLKWYQRYWSNGVRVSEQTTNGLRSPTNVISKAALTQTLRATPKANVSSGPHSVTIPAASIQAAAGQTLSVPITAEILGDAPIRTLLLSVRVAALDGSPQLVSAISFNENAALATSSKITVSAASNRLAVALLDSSVEGLYGTNSLGTLLVTIPSNASSSAAYLVHLQHLDASPNGLTLFPVATNDILITLADRSASSWGDGIPDTWRLRYFGTVSNMLSAASADPDDDGFSNLAEYQVGTNPLDAQSNPLPTRPQLQSSFTSSPPASYTLQWPSQTGRTYVVEMSSDLLSTNWTVISSNLTGTGSTLEFSDTNANRPAKFYRVRAQ